MSVDEALFKDVSLALVSSFERIAKLTQLPSRQEKE